MYSVRINNRFPQVYRVCRPVACVPTRSASVVPRFIGNDFAPFFRLMDDFTSQVTTRPSFDVAALFDAPTFAHNNNATRSFNPRFDVKETNDAYELVGELPGIDQKDLSIEFTGAQTLSIKGRTESHREEGSRPEAKAVESQPEQTEQPVPQSAEVATADDVQSLSDTSSYHQPTVEDEEVTMSGANQEVAAPSQATETQTVAETQQQQVEPQPQTNNSHYWVSERSVGQFQRSFKFPSRVDQDSVHASLKDGILSIVVPKASLPANRRIEIQ